MLDRRAWVATCGLVSAALVATWAGCSGSEQGLVARPRRSGWRSARRRASSRGTLAARRGAPHAAVRAGGSARRRARAPRRQLRPGGGFEEPFAVRRGCASHGERTDAPAERRRLGRGRVARRGARGALRCRGQHRAARGRLPRCRAAHRRGGRHRARAARGAPGAARSRRANRGALRVAAGRRHPRNPRARWRGRGVGRVGPRRFPHRAGVRNRR